MSVELARLIFSIFALVALLTSLSECFPRAKSTLSPVILMPGYGGSKLEARWDPAYNAEGSCERSTDWMTIWVNYKQFYRSALHCLIYTMELEFDENTGASKNKVGLEVRVKDPDRIANIEYLTDHTFMGYDYFATLVNRLVSMGYKRDVNLRGAPYDFRRAPNELGEYMVRLKEMTEEMFVASKEQPVTLICHSMGCLNALYFLQRQAVYWKKKYIRRLISLSAPWGGSVKALRVMALGVHLDLLRFDSVVLGGLSRSFPSTFFLFPNEVVYGDKTLIELHPSEHSGLGKSEIITSKNYDRFFQLIQHNQGLRVWLRVRKLLGNLKAPNVETHCFYGHGVKTLARLIITGIYPKWKETQIFEDGDGTVAQQSASFCDTWKDEQALPVKTRSFSTDHMGILKKDQVLDEIDEILRVS